MKIQPELLHVVIDALASQQIYTQKVVLLSLSQNPRFARRPASACVRIYLKTCFFLRATRVIPDVFDVTFYDALLPCNVRVDRNVFLKKKTGKNRLKKYPYTCGRDLVFEQKGGSSPVFRSVAEAMRKCSVVSRHEAC